MNARLDGMTFSKLDAKALAAYRNLRFDAIWLMGVWRLSPAGIALSKRHAPDFVGSPYAIHEYDFNPLLGDRSDFLRLRDRANKAGLKLILDFVPNHLGLDAPLIDRHPDYFIHSNPGVREEYESDFYHHPAGFRLAHGKDPYFPGWEDTVQLNYTHAGLREYMRRVLEDIAAIADGVRCDMAMLVMRDQIKRQWFPFITQAEFDRHMPGEFWDEAIAAAKRVNPDFIFIAEAYWDTEPALLGLGFDYVYNKRLYDAVLSHDPAVQVRNHLDWIPDGFLRHSINFVENHDEDRVAARVSRSAGRRAAALIALLPGVPLIHQGQMDGVAEKLPVQRVAFREPHEPDAELRQFYRNLLEIASDPIFREGDFAQARSNWDKAVCFWRRLNGTLALIGLPLGDGDPHIPDLVYVTLPPADWPLGERYQSHSDWTHPVILDPTRHFDTICLSRHDVLQSFDPLGGMYIRFDQVVEG